VGDQQVHPGIGVTPSEEFEGVGSTELDLDPARPL
jgi:hypothetical protein